MKKIIFGIISIILTLSASAQNDINCDQIKDQQLHFLLTEGQNFDDLIGQDIMVINSCMELDSIDQILLLDPPIFGTLVFSLTKGNNKLTYGQVLDYMNEIKASEQYIKTREGYQFMGQYGNRKVDKADSVYVRNGFKQMALSDSDLETLMAITYSEKNSGLTYKETLSLFMQSKEIKQNIKPKSPSSSDLIFGHFKEIESIKMIIEKSSSNKPILLYFTGWAIVNGRKMEAALFHSDKVNQQFKEFDCYIGYADDKASATEEQKLEINNDEIKNKGQFIREFEKMIYPKESQPIILIVDQDFKLIDSFGYSQDEQAFIEFLIGNKNGR